jgi:hypothetical protein
MPLFNVRFQEFLSDQKMSSKREKESPDRSQGWIDASPDRKYTHRRWRFVVRRDWNFAKSGMAAFFPRVTAPSDHHTPMTTKLHSRKVPVPSDDKSAGLSRPGYLPADRKGSALGLFVFAALWPALQYLCLRFNCHPHEQQSKTRGQNGVASPFL